MAEWGVTDTGLTAPTSAEITNEIRLEYESRTGVRPSWAPYTFLGAITAAIGVVMGLLVDLVIAVWSAGDENNATGIHLNNVGDITGVSREGASPSRVTVTFGGTNGTVVPQGRIVEGGGIDGAARWRTLETVTIQLGIASVLAECTEDGPTPADVGTITEIVTPVAGVDAVNNAVSATLGRDVESADLFRQRRRAAIAGAASGSPRAILTALLTNDALPLDTATVVQNRDGAEAVVEGVTLPGHSYAVIVHPSTLTTEEREIVLDTIDRKGPVGIETIGDETGTVIGAIDGVAYTVRYGHPTDLNVTHVATITLAPGADLGLVADEGTIANQVDEVIRGAYALLTPGGEITTFRLNALLAAIEGVDGATHDINGSPDLDPLATQILNLATLTVAAAP